ncbi:glycosyltransferase family 2 protein [Planosporangium mesophilum]|uniref:Transferase n=1 Tax=Planosporangium mesophilum TaxID=689768 RepID=A0A8J3X2F9_9ACTN|nr:glycosyltransferase family 2 protein [Planosporangium mesophilum]NJC85812.1 glycosyltransferase [Planosporangium mesophilum]GII21873.1 transferase [Planosporangium mesophilum]
MGTGVSIVVPTVGRPSLATLLDALAPADGVLPMPLELILVDDRRDRPAALVEIPPAFAPVTRIVPGGGAAGPAAARNAGWRAAAYPWIAFLDDDVVPSPDWLAALEDDLDVDESVAGVQGIVEVPLPDDRPPTDWERVTGGLAGARWITADMAYRRDALAAVGGFDERFPRAFREDTDIAYRVRRAGGALTVGRRRVTHPVRPESPWVSLRTQAGNADDALLRTLYGPRWREVLELPPGRRSRHAAVTLAGLVAVGSLGFSLMSSRPRRAARVVGALAGAAWLAGTAEFAAARIAPGPRTRDEVSRMVATSALIPPYAMAQWLRGWLRAR